MKSQGLRGDYSHDTSMELRYLGRYCDHQAMKNPDQRRICGRSPLSSGSSAAVAALALGTYIVGSLNPPIVPLDLQSKQRRAGGWVMAGGGGFKRLPAGSALVPQPILAKQNLRPFYGTNIVTAATRWLRPCHTQHQSHRLSP